MLSLSALRFTSKHLEFNAHPSDLQRPFLAKRLLFDAQTALNFSILITEDNKAKIEVSLDSVGSMFVSFLILIYFNF